MTASSHLPAPNLMPLMRYRELAEAMSWLEEAFGFEKQIAVSDSDGEVIYGQMTYRGSLIMMGAVRDTDLDKLMRQPDEVGGVETQSCYIVVDDADAHYARALDAGADVMLDIKSDGLGRRGYSCRDPQGHIWNFGTYNPGHGLSTSVTVVRNQTVPPPAAVRSDRAVLFSVGSLLLVLGMTVAWFSDEIRSDLMKRVADAAGQQAVAESERAYAELVKVRAEKRKSEEMSRTLSADLEAERTRRGSIEAAAGKATEKLTQEQTARLSAEATIASLQNELKREREAAIEAKRAREEKLSATSTSQAPMPSTNETVAVERAQPSPGVAGPLSTLPSSGVSDIETSAMKAPSDATKAPIPVTSQPAAQSEEDETASRLAESKNAALRPLKTVQNASKNHSAKARRLSTPYVIKLHDVPWPYNTWTK
jgi:uncharacterized glyoxalase superfamily protein PhnB